MRGATPERVSQWRGNIISPRRIWIIRKYGCSWPAEDLLDDFERVAVELIVRFFRKYAKIKE
jgi:hypothetical protein